MTRTGGAGAAAVATARRAVLPLALAQFVASYAASNMNVAISSIDTDLDTAVTGIQTTITLYVDHGGVDDPGQQVDRHLASQVLLPVGTRHLRGAPCPRRSSRGCLC